MAIELSHKSHNAPITYRTIHHFVTEMCTCVHISDTKWRIVGNLFTAIWDLWDGYVWHPLQTYIDICTTVNLIFYMNYDILDSM